MVEITQFPTPFHLSCKQIEAVHDEVERLSHELDITNADHIALWLSENDEHVSWMACRIIEAHEAVVAQAALDARRQADTERDAALAQLRVAREALVPFDVIGRKFVADDEADSVLIRMTIPAGAFRKAAQALAQIGTQP